jgi:hypothetical protein
LEMDKRIPKTGNVKAKKPSGTSTNKLKEELLREGPLGYFLGRTATL